MPTTFAVEEVGSCSIVRLQSEDGTNLLQRECVESLTDTLRSLAAARAGKALVITGNDKFFSAGADLTEVSALTGPAAYEFSKIGQALMSAIDDFPAPTFAAISGYCMGGGLDVALACRYRIATLGSIFGHRGAALGLITGWGGTQRLPRLIGRSRALQMFIAAEKLNAEEALHTGLVDAVANDPIAASVLRNGR